MLSSIYVLSMKIKASMDELKNFNFRFVCPEEINQKLKSIDIKKSYWVWQHPR